MAARGTQQLEGNPVRLGAKTESMRGKGNFLAWTRDPPLFMALHSVHISGRPMHRLNLKNHFSLLFHRVRKLLPVYVRPGTSDKGGMVRDNEHSRIFILLNRFLCTLT